MMNKIIIASDLGHFKAFRVTKEPLESPRITLIKSYDSIEGHGKLGDKLSDSAGGYMRKGGKNEVAKGYSEPHNLGLEIQKKIIKMIAKDINTLIDSEDCKKWYLAAGKKINSQIIKNLKPEIKARLD
ncbi:MAG: host attachment protein [Candidatus Mariimomonas ferrooxydans]